MPLLNVTHIFLGFRFKENRGREIRLRSCCSSLGGRRYLPSVPVLNICHPRKSGREEGNSEQHCEISYRALPIFKQDSEEQWRGEIGSGSKLQRREREGKRLFFFSLSTYLVIEADSRRHPTLNRRVCHASRNAVPCRTLLCRFQIPCFVSKSPVSSP